MSFHKGFTRCSRVGLSAEQRLPQDQEALLCQAVKLAQGDLVLCLCFGRFEDLLRAITMARSDICEAMVFALDNAESASEVRVEDWTSVWSDVVRGDFEPS